MFLNNNATCEETVSQVALFYTKSGWSLNPALILDEIGDEGYAEGFTLISLVCKIQHQEPNQGSYTSNHGYK